MSIKQQDQNFCLIQADDATKPERQDCMCLNTKMAKYLWTPIQMLLVAYEHQCIKAFRENTFTSL